MSWKILKRLLKWLSVLLLLAMLWVGFVAWRIVSFGRRDEAKKADAAIVLGAAAWDKRPSPVLEERINHAINLHKRGLVAKLIFTGGYGAGAPMAESEVARDYALKHGIPEQDILIETQSRSTLENVRGAKKILQENRLTTAVVVSDPLQMCRAMAMCEDEGLQAVPSPTPTTRYRSFEEKADFLRQEIYKYHAYCFSGK